MAAQPILSDINHEIHTVVVDSTGPDFVVHLPTPLDNVIQAQLVSAVFTSGDSAQTAIHIGIEELRTFFSQRAKADLDSSDDNHLNGVFGTVVGPHVSLTGASTATAVKVISFKNEYPISQYYHNPIRKLSRLTFNLDRENGDPAVMTASVLVFKFVCKNKNLGC
tara:strand:+ start:1125 stop:1619 length:495 start_codon:yes stop_codon:yes gene_type:complete